MENANKSQRSDALIKEQRWQRFIEKTTLAFATACSGVVLYQALFPSFYYMAWLFFGIMLWAVVAAGCLFQVLALQAIARWKRVTLASSPANGVAPPPTRGNAR